MGLHQARFIDHVDHTSIRPLGLLQKSRDIGHFHTHANDSEKFTSRAFNTIIYEYGKFSGTHFISIDIEFNTFAGVDKIIIPDVMCIGSIDLLMYSLVGIIAQGLGRNKECRIEPVFETYGIQISLYPFGIGFTIQYPIDQECIPCHQR